MPTAGRVSELSRPWAKVTSIGDGVEDASGTIATVEGSSVSDPVDPNTLLLQCEKHHKSGKGDSAGERRGSDAKRERVVSKPRSSEGESAY